MHNYEHEIEMPVKPAIEKFLWCDYFHDSAITSVEQVRKQSKYYYGALCDYVITLQCERDTNAEWQRKNKGLGGKDTVDVDFYDEKFTYYLTFKNVYYFHEEQECSCVREYLNGRFKDTALLREKRSDTGKPLLHFRMQIVGGYMDFIFNDFQIRKAIGRVNYQPPNWEKKIPKALTEEELVRIYTTVENKNYDMDEFDVFRGIERLYKQGDEKLLEYVRNAIKNTAYTDDVPPYCAYILGKIGDGSDVPWLINLWQKGRYVLERRNILDAIELITQRGIKQFGKEECVRLVSFENKQKPLSEVCTADDYWKLIGQTGVVVETKNRRALVKFNCKVKDFGVHCHNIVPNTLWIGFEDLEKV